MWPFTQSNGQSKDSRRISDLEESFRTLRSEVKALDLEFSGLYDKVRSALGRMAKRAGRLEASQEAQDGEDPVEPNSDDTALALPGLTKRQLDLNARILATRGRHGG